MNRSLHEVGSLGWEAGAGIAHSLQVYVNHEKPRAVRAYQNGVSQRRSRSTRSYLFLQGCMAPVDAPLYWRAISRLEAEGNQVFLNPVPWLPYNLGNLDSTIRELLAFVEGKGISGIVGHSQGGNAGLHMAVKRSIPVVTYGSPTLGTPAIAWQRSLKRWTSIRTYEDRWELGALQRSVFEQYSRLQVLAISAGRDRVAPQASCDLGLEHFHCPTAGHSSVVLEPGAHNAMVSFLGRHQQSRLPLAA
jgi:hypothetical protein